MGSSSAAKTDTNRSIPALDKIKFKARGRGFVFRDALAYRNNQLAGVFCFRLDGKMLIAHGTRVLPRYQKQGIGTALWTAAIEKYKPDHIIVSTISRAGDNLVLHMKMLYPEISWDWE